MKVEEAPMLFRWLQRTGFTSCVNQMQELGISGLILINAKNNDQYYKKLYHLTFYDI